MLTKELLTDFLVRFFVCTRHPINELRQKMLWDQVLISSLNPTTLIHTILVCIMCGKASIIALLSRPVAAAIIVRLSVNTRTRVQFRIILR